MKTLIKSKGTELKCFLSCVAGKRDSKKKFPKPFEREEGRQGDHERGAGDGARYDDSHKHGSSRRFEEINAHGNLLLIVNFTYNSADYFDKLTFTIISFCILQKCLRMIFLPNTESSPLHRTIVTR